MAKSFNEIELKFVVGPSPRLRRQLIDQIEALSPSESYHVNTQDTYFKTKRSPGFIYRLRQDQRLCQLTVKSTKIVNSSRYEVNLDLAAGKKTAEETVAAFLEPLGVQWKGKLTKKVDVFLFPDCEIVYYVAKYGKKAVCCLEIEATRYRNLGEAGKVIAKYTDLLGFAKSAAVNKSLFEILVGVPHVRSGKNSKRS